MKLLKKLKEMIVGVYATGDRVDTPTGIKSTVEVERLNFNDWAKTLQISSAYKR